MAQRRSVDLPLPEETIIETVFPFSTEREMPFKTSFEPNRFLRSRISKTDILLPSLIVIVTEFFLDMSKENGQKSVE